MKKIVIKKYYKPLYLHVSIKFDKLTNTKDIQIIKSTFSEQERTRGNPKDSGEVNKFNFHQELFPIYEVDEFDYKFRRIDVESMILKELDKWF